MVEITNVLNESLKAPITLDEDEDLNKFNDWKINDPPVYKEDSHVLSENLKRMFLDYSKSYRKQGPKNIYYGEFGFTEISFKKIGQSLFADLLEKRGIKSDNLVFRIYDSIPTVSLRNTNSPIIQHAITSNRELMFIVTRYIPTAEDMLKLRLHFLLKKSLIVPLGDQALELIIKCHEEKDFLNFTRHLVYLARDIMAKEIKHEL